MEHENNITPETLLKSSGQNSFLAMSKCKHILRKAATETRDNLFKQNNLSVESVDCILTSCSRAVFTQDVSFAKCLQQKHSLARKHLRVDSSVQFISAPQVSLELSQARHSHLSENIQRCESRGNMQNLNSSTRQRCMSKSLHLSSLVRQWIPISKFVSFSVIAVCASNSEHEQELITETEAVLLQLAQYWTPFLDG